MDIERRVSSCAVDGHPVRVEWFLPDAGQALPTVLLLHGRDGPAGSAGDRSYQDLASAVAAGGFRVALPWYFDRVPEDEPTGDPLDEIGREIERYGLWLRAIGAVLRVAPEITRPVGLLGYSLGGYLALTAAMSWPGIAAVAVCYAGVPSPFVGLAGNLPPTLVLHGLADAVIPASEATSLGALLRQHRVPHEIHLYPAAGHGFHGEDAEDAVRRVATFFHQHLGSPQAQKDPAWKIE